MLTRAEQQQRAARARLYRGVPGRVAQRAGEQHRRGGLQPRWHDPGNRRVQQQVRRRQLLRLGYRQPQAPEHPRPAERLRVGEQPGDQRGQQDRDRDGHPDLPVVVAGPGLPVGPVDG